MVGTLIAGSVANRYRRGTVMHAIPYSINKDLVLAWLEKRLLSIANLFQLL